MRNLMIVMVVLCSSRAGIAAAVDDDVEAKIAKLPKKLKGVPPLGKAAVDDATAAKAKAAVDEAVKLRATDAARAEARLREALTLDPASLVARYELASFFAAGGKSDPALALLLQLNGAACDECFRLVESSKLDDDWRALWLDDRWVYLVVKAAQWPDGIAGGWFETGCPAGTKMVKKGRLPAEGEEARAAAVWCEKSKGRKRVKHGPYTEWQGMPSWSHSNAETTQKAIEGEYADGVRVGIWSFWGGADARNGYRDGEKHGLWVELVDLGPSHMAYDVGVFIDGVADGLHLHYDSNAAGYGVPAVEEEYRAGVRHGRYLRREGKGDDGKIVAQGSYVDDKQDGAWREIIDVLWLGWYLDGAGAYVAGVRDGVWTIEEEGVKTWQLTYVAGVLDGEQRQLGISGTVLGSFALKRDEGAATIWNAAGVKIAEGKVKGGRRVGLWTVYDDAGAKIGQGAFNDRRQPDGPWTKWHPNGATAEVGTWKRDSRDGKWSFFYADGKKQAEGTFKEGSAVGTWKVWNDTGAAQKLTMDRHGDIAKVDSTRLDEPIHLSPSEPPAYQP